jgi:hypothetical protein
MKLVRLSDLFEVKYGHSFELNRLKLLPQSKGGIPFVSRKARNNGIAAYVAPIDCVEPAPAGELSCALSGGVLSTFLQEKPYYTAFHVARLRAKVSLSTEQLLYYCLCIKANDYRYSYGRQANRTIKDIKIPSLDDIPDFVTETDIARFDGCNAAYSSSEPMELDISSWEPFEIQELFEIKKGKRLTKADMRSGMTPHIGSSASNNGVTAMIGQEPIHDGNTLSVAYNGSVAETFYQAEPYWATDDVNALYPKFSMTPAIGLFIATLIRRERYRFSYGRKWHLDRMKTSTIRLPVTEDGQPDFDLMDRYIKSLPYSSQIGTSENNIVV